MAMNIVFFFTVLSIIGNSHKGVHCVNSPLLKKYIEFNENNLNSFNWICHAALYNERIYDTTKVLHYYTGLIRVHNDYLINWLEINFNVIKNLKSVIDWTVNTKQSHNQLIWSTESDKIIIHAKKWNLYSIYINETYNNTEIFNQCANIFNLLITPTNLVSEYVQFIVNEKLEFDNKFMRITPMSITLNHGHILLLLKNYEEEREYIKSHEEKKKSFIVRLIKETLVNILDGMNHVLKDISRRNNDLDAMKLELLRSMYSTANDAVRLVYIITSKHFPYNGWSKNDAQEEFRWAYETFRRYFLNKWDSIERHTYKYNFKRLNTYHEVDPPKLYTMDNGEGRLTINNYTGVKVRISILGYYHFINIDNDKQEIKDIIGNKEVQFLLNLKLWLIMIYQFAEHFRNHFCSNIDFAEMPTMANMIEAFKMYKNELYKIVR